MLRRSPVFLHDPLEKLQRRGFVSLRGSHRFQDLALMVDGAPQIAELAVDLHEHLVQMPAPLRIAAHVRDASLPNLGGEHWAKTVPPESDGLVADVDPTLGQQILDVAQRQRVSHVHHHHQTDHLWRAVEISEWIAHAPRLTHPAVREFALTPPSGPLGQAPSFEIHLRFEALRVAEDRGDGERSSATLVANKTILGGDVALDSDLVPSLGMTDVIDRDVVMRAPEKGAAANGVRSPMRLSAATWP